MFRGIYEVISPPLIYNYFVEPTTLDRFDCFLVVSRELRSAVDCSDKCDRTLGRTYHEMGHQGSLDSWDPFFLGGIKFLMQMYGSNLTRGSSNLLIQITSLKLTFRL